MPNETYHDLPAITSIINQVIKGFEQQVYPTLRQIAKEEIAKEVRRGNKLFTVTVDGKAGDFAMIDSAKKVIRVQFAQQALKLALEIIRAELRKAIAASTITRTGHLRDDLMIMYGAPGKPYRNVNDAAEIDFEVGGLVAVFPTAKYAGIVNHYVTQGSARSKVKERARRNAVRATKGQGAIKSKVGRGVGFMGVAAENIRRAIGNVRGQKNQSIKVKAIFSTAIPAQAGLNVSKKLLGRGWPVIIIELRGTQSAGVVRV